ncbi:DUF927 domain-containing protein [Myxococcota bacterium]|nr:DUF927 domain-containing protein [Myxococcota bacterium]
MSDDWMTEVCGIDPKAANDDAGAEGLAALRRLADSVKDGDLDAARTAMAAFLADEGSCGAAVLAARHAPAKVQAIVLELGAKRGLRGTADDLAVALRREARRRPVRRAPSSEGGETARSVGGALADELARDDLPEGLRAPPGWSVGPGGIYRVELDDDGEERWVHVASRPLIVTARCRDIDTGAVSLRAEWPTTRCWHNRMAPRAELADSRSLIGLAAWDAPVHSMNARAVVQYLADFQEANTSCLPEARVSSTMGWQGRGGAEGFLWGRAHLLRGAPERAGEVIEDLAPIRWDPRQVYLQVGEGHRELAEAFRSSGTFEGWLAAITGVTPYPRVMLAVYASFLPPLMEFLPALPNFVLDYAGETSQGKTTTLRVAASVWGSPDDRGRGVVRTWDASPTWIERAAAFLGHLPLLLDDTKRARRPEDVGKVLYEVANGQGRGRGSADGLRASATWRTVLLSTGEAPATSFTQDGGTRARTLSLWGSPFGVPTAETARAVKELAAGLWKHHGHAGPRTLRWLLEGAGAAEKLAGWWDEALAIFADLAGDNPVAGRAAHYVAGLAVGKAIAHEVLGIPVPAADPLADAWDAVLAASTGADRAADALRDVLSWASRHQGNFFGRLEGDNGSDDPPPSGWFGTWPKSETWAWLAVLPVSLGAFLTEQGYDAAAVQSTWADRGWLVRDADGHHLTKKLRVGERRARCVVVARAACDLVIGGGDG